MLNQTADPSDASIEISVRLITDTGGVRERNEDAGIFYTPSDSAVLEEKGTLVIIADGMGGHSGGEVASKLAVETIGRSYYEQENNPAEALKVAFQEANRQIYENSTSNEDLNGMGTTCTALAIYDGSAVVAHVGDSRLYLLRGSDMYLMT
ncbi:MAG: protein phosphatase 2C domain-containing protein, partial [Acidobacteriota bacterium]|nr:protein phosphatase 2C domain-containing protein [Acidobacteriota bacterium]